LYVNDLIIARNPLKLIDGIKVQMSQVFEMKDIGVLHYCLGLEFWINIGHTFVFKGTYVKEFFKKFKMDQCKALVAPMT